MAKGLGFATYSAAYTDARGKAIARDKVREDAKFHANVLSAKLKNITRNALNNGTSAARFQEDFIKTLKEGYIQMGILGRGGKARTTSADYLKMGNELKKQYKFLHGFTQDLIDGKLTLKQALARAGQYGANSLQVFSEMEKEAVSRSSIQWARRRLNPGAKHCIQCVSYATFPNFVLASQIVPIATNCDCRGNCQCTIEYAVNPAKKLRASA